MAHAVWVGNISFGLVNIPVQLFSGESKHQLGFHLIDRRTKSRVRYVRVNEETGEEVSWDDIVKGYEVDKDEYVLLSNEELERIQKEVSPSIEIEEFIDVDKISPAFFEKPYILTPQKKSEKAYVLLREVLQKENKAGIAKVVIRQREHLMAIIAVENALMVNFLRFADEVKDLSEFTFPDKESTKYQIHKKELDLSMQLVESLTSSEWDPSKYHDEYAEALQQWVDEKLASHQMDPLEPEDLPEVQPAQKDNVIDIVALLEKSLGKNKKKSARKTPARTSTRTKAKTGTKRRQKKSKSRQSG